jgi:hypothetical protein
MLSLARDVVFFSELRAIGRRKRKQAPRFCHSERSEESLFDLRGGKHTNEERFFASLRMTMFWFFAQPLKPRPTNREENTNAKKRGGGKTKARLPKQTGLWVRLRCLELELHLEGELHFTRQTRQKRDLSGRGRG